MKPPSCSGMLNEMARRSSPAAAKSAFDEIIKGLLR